MALKHICRFIALIAITTIEAQTEKDFEYFFEKLEKVNETERVFSQNLQIVKKDNSIFYVNGEVEQFIELNDDYKIDIAIYRAEKEGDEYVVFVSLPRKGCCEFLQSYYKMIIYDGLKNHSNAPHYDTCPIPAEKYVVKDYPFDAKSLQTFMQPGYYRVDAYLYKDDVAVIGHQIFGHIIGK